MSINNLSDLPQEFWKTKSLSELSQQQWESLCDGCAKCCTLKLEDEDDSVIYDTNVVCQYLDSDTCLCQCYTSRSKKVPNCVTLTKDNIDEVYFMPPQCSYRLVAEKKPLPNWHHLISHDKQSIHKTGHSVKGKVISEKDADDLFLHLTGPLEK
ncbi:MAG: YcgN family cysteine cluster protein [Pseudomonadota bacterium]